MTLNIGSLVRKSPLLMTVKKHKSLKVKANSDSQLLQLRVQAKLRLLLLITLNNQTKTKDIFTRLEISFLFKNNNCGTFVTDIVIAYYGKGDFDNERRVIKRPNRRTNC